MNEPINLNKARKARDRAAARDQAAANRAKFGRTKGETVGAKAAADQARKLLDGAKREE